MPCPKNPEKADEDLRNELTPLSQLRPGQKAVVRQVNTPQALAHRLFALGIVPGTEVEVVRTAALGDPMELLVRGFHIALRKRDAEFLKVEVPWEPKGGAIFGGSGEPPKIC